MNSAIADSGHRLWSDSRDGIEIRFVGRGPGDRTAAAAAAGAPPDLAWCRQIHSARILSATVGRCGDGDALTTRRPGLALSLVTADCVPVLVGGDGEIAAIHAGWRGIVAGIVAETLARVETPAERLTAWLGPAIGPCCYEVGEEVAARVAAASSPEARALAPGPRPHLDLQRAVESQLQRAGVRAVRRIPVCTRCAPESLHSYRQDGPGAGRNLSFVWLSG